MQALKVTVVPVTPFAQNCSIVACTATDLAAVVDPGGDLVEDILAYTARKVIRRGNKKVFQGVHYLEPGNYAMAFRMDLFHFDPAKPIHPELRPSAYRAWLACTAARIGELVQRSVVAAFYYLRLIKVMWFDAAVGATDKPPLEAKSIGLALALFSFPVVLIGLIWLYPAAGRAAHAFGLA